MMAFLVRVCWGHGEPGDRRLVAVGPDVTAVLHCGHGHAAADEHLVADAHEAGPWPQVADVIIDRSGTSAARFPGRLVAITGHVLEVATGWRARLVPLSAGDELWPYASFVHAWLVAGRPFEALYGACLLDDSSGRGVRVTRVAYRRAVS
jgi:hypothetical protein